MSRINTNVSSLIGQRVLNQNTSSLNQSLERLSTGLRINRGKDDPAGLIASENLRSEKFALGQAIKNAERADQVVSIAEGGLQEISNLLTELQGLITQTANTGGISKEEREANQLQIDSILQTIDRVASATSFQSLKLLNGGFDYQTSGVADEVASFKVHGAKLNPGDSRDVNVIVTASAQKAGFVLSFGATSVDLGSATDRFVFELTGTQGAREFSFASGTPLTEIIAAINSFKDVTGVEASISGTTAIRVESTEFGTDEFVSVRVVDDGSIASGNGIYSLLANDASSADTVAAPTAFSNASNKVTDRGQDVGAVINGIVATTKGKTARIDTDFLKVELELEFDTGSVNANAAVLGSLSAFTITGGGADFQLASRVDIAGKVSLGVQNVAARELGRSTTDVSGNNATVFLSDLSTGGSLNVVDGDLTASQKVVGQAIKDLSSLRGRLGAFQKNTIGATIRSLGISLENTTAAESVIRDTDFAGETADLTRAQILVNSNTNVLSIANSQPQAVLQLLG